LLKYKQVRKGGKGMEEEINKISNKNLRQLLNLLDGLNASDSIKESVKSFFWKNSDEILNKIKER
jgi:hypothetical protein